MQLAPASPLPDPGPPSSPPELRSSEVVVHVEVPLARIRALLESRVPKRLADERGVGIGPAGVVNYRVERGPLAVTVEDGALLVEAPITAHAEACRRGRCYAKCDPTATARARVSLLLDEEYRFAPSELTVTFEKGCRVRTLGGFLTIDVTPTLKAAVEARLARVARDIDARLPQLRPALEEPWQRLQSSWPWPLNGCASVAPSRVVQGPVERRGDTAVGRFALGVSPELRTPCGAAPSPKPLPRLERDVRMPARSAVALGLVSPLAALERAFEAVPGVVLDGRSARITSARAEPRGREVSARLRLEGDVCGEVTLLASPRFSGEGESIELASPHFDAADDARLRDAGLDPAALGRTLAAAGRFPAPLTPRAVNLAAPAVAPMLSTKDAKISVELTGAEASGAATHGRTITAWLELRGNVRVKLGEAP